MKVSKPADAEVIVHAPSRLHFGLFAVGELVERKFGGIGLMVDSPGNQISFSPAEKLTLAGEDAELLRDATELWFKTSKPKFDCELSELPARIEFVGSARRHVGLGSGTQITLAINAGLNCFFTLPTMGDVESAAQMQRGKRSAIGSYGFFQGGFLADRGVAGDDVIAPLDLRIDFPTDWPIVLLISKRTKGLFGSDEQDAFCKLPDVTPTSRDEMIDIARQQIIPAILARDYDQFAPAVYEFGHRCGMFFSEHQGGPFNGPLATQLVNTARDFGIEATAQSSWGPCIFACARNDEQAKRLVAHVADKYGDAVETITTRANNDGHVIETKSTVGN